MPPLNEAVDIVIGELLSDIAEGVVAPEVDLQDEPGRFPRRLGFVG